MVDTSQNLLNDARASLRSATWNRLVRIYTPLISRWLVRFGVAPPDVPDLTQEVLLAMSTDLPKFEHNGRPGAFRNWLRGITLNRCRRHWRRARPASASSQAYAETERALDELADQHSELTELWDAEHDQHVLKGLMEILKREYGPESLQVFYELTMLEHSPVDVAEAHGWTLGRVYKLKFRMMKRLRELGQLLLS